MRRTAVVALLVLLLAGCASTTNKLMVSWVGHTAAELVQSWGAPASVVPDGKGGQVYVWRWYVDLGTNYNYGYAHSNGWWRVREFYVNPEGVIYSWRWRGL